MAVKLEIPELLVEERKVTGRKVKTLRGEGVLPGNIYGREVKSLAVQVPVREFVRVYKEVGETGLVKVKVGGEERPVLVHEVQVDPVSGVPLHVGFRQVSLTERTEVKVPVVLVGEAPVEKQGGVVVQVLSEVEVVALPTDLPEEVEVDISSLGEVGAVVKVGDLKIDKRRVEMKTDAGQIVAKVEAPSIEEEKPATVAAEKEGGEGAVETGGESGTGLSTSEGGGEESKGEEQQK